MKFKFPGGLAAVVAVVWMVGTISPAGANSETYKQLNLFGDVFERIRAGYVEEVTDTDMIEAAIRGMLADLDPHSSYLTADDFKNMQVQTRGEFGGLGIEVTMENGVVRVVSPIDDTPADRAGVQAGDYITHLDGEQVMGMSLTDAVDLMRGPVDTTITLTIVREGAEAPIELELTRAVIKIQSVRHRTEGDVGYIRISSFNEQTETGVKDAIKALDEEIGDKLKGYVLDMRNNPGGLLDQAVAVSDAFLDQGEIVQTRGRDNRDIQRYNAGRGDLAKGKTIVVLINGGSASASEIVAGALQDHERALVIGTQTFGKGSVQTIIPLGSDGALRLTTARYYTPSGRSIQAKGIEPDITVEQLRLAEAQPARAFRTEASLRGHLGNGIKEPPQTTPDPATAADDESDQDTEGDKEKSDNGKKDDDGAANDNTTASTDYQLSYAIDLLRGIAMSQKRAAR
ncbi:MAG: S41 family peptidase [Sphingomonadales bacterium]